MSKASETTSSATGRAPLTGSLGAILLLALIWGLSIPLTKLGLETLPPLTLTALRFALALPLLFFLSRRQRLPPQALARVALLGLIGISVGQVAQTFGVEGTSAPVGAILSATIPVFVVAFAALRLRQRVNRGQMAGLLAAFAGIALVASGAGAEDAASAANTAGGVLWMLISSIAIAFYYVWSAELTREYGVPVVAAWSTLFGFLAVTPLAFNEMAGAPLHLTFEGLAAAAYLGVFVTVVGLFLWLRLLNTVPAVVATSVHYLHPVIGIVAGALIFGGELGATFFGGVALILGGLILAVTPERRARSQ